MKISVQFGETNQNINASFGEINDVSDGGFERGYAEGYEDGYSHGADKSVEDAMVSRTITNYNNDRVTHIGQAAFYFCATLESVSFKNAETADNYSFRYCGALKRAEFPKATMIGTGAFEYCYVLTALVLRSETVCSLRHTSAFNNCYHILGTVNKMYNPNGLKDGFIYVPQALVEQYKTATNWSTYASQIRAIEDYPDICG